MALFCAVLGTLSLLTSEQPAYAQDKASAKDLVNALHAAFGEHHARAVHTKGVMFEGNFTPDPEAKTLTKEPIFAGDSLPVVARFSDFAGVPTVPDNDDGAAPAGFAVKIKAADSDDFDIESNQHKDFITATTDEFRTFLLALAKANKGDKAPLNAFLDAHPHAKEFLASRTYPVSYAKATYFGINSVKFTNEKGQSIFVRYRFVPRAGEQYLSPDERKAQGTNYLQDEIVKRLADGPIVFDWYAQVAEASDKVEDPSIAWPDTRKKVKLGTFSLTKQPADPDAAQRALLFRPGQPHPGVEPADPMLVLRNEAYPISFKERQ
jgi:catalase